MKTAGLRIPLLLCAGLLLAACGPGSKLQRTEFFPANGSLDYALVVVGDFPSEPSRSVPPELRGGYNALAHAAGQRFELMLIAQMREYGVRGDIVRGPSRPGALQVEGVVTFYDEGNAALRGLVGFGAGAADYEATVRLLDTDSGRLLGTIVLDKRSVLLPGVLSPLHDVEILMQSAAARAAEEIAIAMRVHRRGQVPASKTRRVGCGRGGPGCQRNN